LDFATR
jgi:hypothetical protein